MYSIKIDFHLLPCLTFHSKIATITVADQGQVCFDFGDAIFDFIALRRGPLLVPFISAFSTV